MRESVNTLSVTRLKKCDRIVSWSFESGSEMEGLFSAKFPHSPTHHYTSIYGALLFSVSPVRCTCIIKYGAVRKFFPVLYNISEIHPHNGQKNRFTIVPPFNSTKHYTASILQSLSYDAAFYFALLKKTNYDVILWLTCEMLYGIDVYHPCSKTHIAWQFGKNQR